MKSETAPPVRELLNLSGRAVVVTGASGTIGAGIARRLAEAGASLVLQFHENAEACDRLAADIKAGGGSALLVQGDLTSEGFAEELLDTGVKAFGSVYGVVNNAAIQPVAGFGAITNADMNQMMQTNLTGPFALLRALARQSGGPDAPRAAVNIASIEGLQPAEGHSHYAASKAALIMLTKAAALELGSGNMRVNSVSPGLIRRDGIEGDWPEGVERWQAAAPLGRLGTATDVADAVLFLLSDAARWITGVNLVVDGGVTSGPTW